MDIEGLGNECDLGIWSKILKDSIKILCWKKFMVLFCVCEYVPECLSMNHLSAWCQVRPVKSIGSPETGIIDMLKTKMWLVSPQTYFSFNFKCILWGLTCIFLGSDFWSIILLYEDFTHVYNEFWHPPHIPKNFPLSVSVPVTDQWLLLLFMISFV